MVSVCADSERPLSAVTDNDNVILGLVTDIRGWNYLICEPRPLLPAACCLLPALSLVGTMSRSEPVSVS